VGTGLAECAGSAASVDFDTDRIDNTGLVTLRHQGQLHHIGIGRTHAGTGPAGWSLTGHG
jgi:hypothetical protein